eukprot:1492975-Rhodomonas_salina.2
MISYSHPLSQFPSRVVIVEFARCYTIELTELESIGAAKRNQYHQLSLYLQAMYSDHEVNCLSFILSVLGVYPQEKWVSNCEALKFLSFK